MSDGSKKTPTVPIAEFQRICAEEPKSVYIPLAVLDTARRDFKLGSRTEVLDFVVEIDNAEHINTTLWDNNPLKEIHPSDVDAFSFLFGGRSGYLAYCRNHKANNWLLKSLKLNLVGDHQGGFNILSEAFLKSMQPTTREKK